MSGKKVSGNGGVHKAMLGWLLAICLAPLAALADPVAVKIKAQPLGDALNTLAEQTGLQLIYDGALVAGITAPAVEGRMEPTDALRRALEGSGLVYRFTGKNTMTIKKAPDTGGAKLIGPVRVQGAEVNGVAGINGSTDATATEGTKSYTSSGLSIASKTAQSIKDTPQTVSVITQQRLQDQNLTDFTSVMNQATGVTLVKSGDGLSTDFYSRGFQISHIQIDGGAPLSLLQPSVAGNALSTYYTPLIDMAMYDHVEILRGADGLFNGYGDPAGAVNLTRKRPLDHPQVVIEGMLGSWSNYSTMIDASAPLGFDGRLRGRAVLSYQDQDYFYDTASNSHTTVYGILEADLTPNTIISAGFSNTRQDTVPWFAGLPRYENGNDLKLPRNTCLCFPWNRWNFETKELFASIEQHFGENWSAKLNLTRVDQHSVQKYGQVIMPVNSSTGMGPKLSGAKLDAASVQTTADLTVNGEFRLFGQQQKVVFGLNGQNMDMSGVKFYESLYPYPFPSVDVLHFNPNAPEYREPASSLPRVC